MPPIAEQKSVSWEASLTQILSYRQPLENNHLERIEPVESELLTHSVSFDGCRVRELLHIVAGFADCWHLCLEIT